MAPSFRHPLRASLDYVSSGMRTVDGRLDRRSGEIIRDLLICQVETGVGGAVGEVGGSSGKLLALLHLLTRPNERTFLIATGPAGRDALALVIATLDRQGGAGRDLVVVEAPDGQIEPRAVADACGPVRFLSLAGAADEALVLAHLRQAELVLGTGGIVALDDALNQEWPGVTAGAGRYLAGAQGDLIPFALSQNKLYLARPPFPQRYRDRLRHRLPRLYKKTATFFGAEVDIYGVVAQPMQTTALPYELEAAARIIGHYGRDPKALATLLVRWLRRRPLVPEG